MKNYYKIPKYKSISPEEAITLLALSIDAYNDVNRVGLEKIANCFEQQANKKRSMKSISRDIHSLADKGLVRIISHFEGGKRLNEYVLNNTYTALDSSLWEKTSDCSFYAKSLFLGLCNLQYKNSMRVSLKDEEIRSILCFGRDNYKKAINELLAAKLITTTPEGYRIAGECKTSFSEVQRQHFTMLFNNEYGYELLKKYFTIITPITGGRVIKANDDVVDPGLLVDRLYEKIFS